MFKQTYSYSRIGLVPTHPSDIISRNNCNTVTSFLGFTLELPLITAPMSTLVSPELANQLYKLGGLAVLPRVSTIDDLEETLVSVSSNRGFIQAIPSISANLLSTIERIKALEKYELTTLCIDTANGYSSKVLELVRIIKSLFPFLYIIAGNIGSVQGYRALDLAGADAIRVGIGTGCFAGDTRILMSDGFYKNIKDIKIHDKVINMYGKPVEVTAVKFSGFKRVIAYKNNFFYKKTNVTPDHLHYVADYSSIQDINKNILRKVLIRPNTDGTSKINWRRIDQSKKSCLLFPKKINFDIPQTFTFSLKNFSFSRRNFTKFQELPDLNPSYNLGYLIGTYLGDGHARISSSLRKNGKRNTVGSTNWYFGINEDDIALKLQKTIYNLFNLKAKIHKVKEKNVTIVTLYCNTISRWLVTFGKKEKKHLPKDYFCSNKKYLKGIYDGLIDSDGNYDEKDTRKGVSNTSTDVIELFTVISLYLNKYLPSICIRPPTIGNLDNCNIDNCKESYMARTVKRPEFNSLEDYQFCKIYSIEEKEILIPTYDIEVNCPTHSFIANNSIVHNSACITSDSTGLNCGQASLIRECAEYKDNYHCHAKIIADGGVKSPADFCKALALGADIVMAGYIFAGCEESKGRTFSMEGVKYKSFAGEASQKVKQCNTYIEGIELMVPYTGPVVDTWTKFTNGLRSSMSYMNCETLEEFRYLPDENFVIID